MRRFSLIRFHGRRLRATPSAGRGVADEGQRRSRRVSSAAQPASRTRGGRARHIGIGVTYTRRRLEQDPRQAHEVIGAVIDDFGQLANALLATANQEMATLVRSSYGVEPAAFHAEAIRLMRLRLRSIGFLVE